MRKELQLEEPESPDIAYGLLLSFPETASRPVLIKTSSLWALDTSTVALPHIWVQVEGVKSTQPIMPLSSSSWVLKLYYQLLES